MADYRSEPKQTPVPEDVDDLIFLDEGGWVTSSRCRRRPQGTAGGPESRGGEGGRCAAGQSPPPEALRAVF